MLPASFTNSQWLFLLRGFDLNLKVSSVVVMGENIR